MTPTPPLRPIHPWPGVARGLGARVKGHVLPDSPKSAPLTGGRFRRPAKTHEGTPSGAHFSRRCRVWWPAGGPRGCRGAGYVYGSPPRVTGCGRAGPIRVRGRRLRDGPAGGDAPRGRAGRCRANGRPSNTARAARPMTGHRAEPVADVTPPDVGSAWKGIRHPATMRHVGEHICGFTPFPYSPYSRGNGPGGAISGVVATSCFVGTGYRPKARESGIPSDVETRAGTRWTREHHLKKWEPSSGSKDIHSLYFSFTS